MASPAQLRVEALRLYRDILRASRAFTWQHESGKSWSVVLQESARKEFEANRHETDQEKALKLVVIGRQAYIQVADQFAKKQQELKQRQHK